ncbi:alpha/beta hydrolase [Acaryochloris marina]|uniref:alpha/beta hydrolase n=1 Tax=Acaryochloris marina TaxID=155978 RepID=UPI0021C488D2|nr:alpha/beta hydrolase [Acaryochloris marina]BDM83084.1 hypothetical protein AM10699_59450 [Acaryochloris marina MBIC10699]
MAQSIEGISGRIWDEFYTGFHYFERDLVRDGCHALIFEHAEPTDKAIVLVHGLSDSPYFMSEIGEYFHQMGYNVYVPLLHFHGLKEPMGMEDVEVNEWKANVNFAIDVANDKAEQVSIGGLSTGGTLSVLMAATHPSINGELYLFSAALDLAGGRGGWLGESKERILRTPLARWLEPLVNIILNRTSLIGENPYRYEYVDLDGAEELAKLIKETDTLLRKYSSKEPFPKRVFAAHSEFDSTADIAGIRKLQSVSDPALFRPYFFDKKLEISHASVVLKNPIPNTGEPILEKANPYFSKMMTAIKKFQDG